MCILPCAFLAFETTEHGGCHSGQWTTLRTRPPLCHAFTKYYDFRKTKGAGDSERFSERFLFYVHVYVTRHVFVLPTCTSPGARCTHCWHRDPGHLRHLDQSILQQLIAIPRGGWVAAPSERLDHFRQQQIRRLQRLRQRLRAVIIRVSPMAQTRG